MSAIRIIIASALIAGALIKAAPALADPVPQAAAKLATAIVGTADLDLSTRVGRTTLDHRLVVAAHQVCGQASVADLAGTNAMITCRASVLNDARTSGRALASVAAARRPIIVADNR